MRAGPFGVRSQMAYGEMLLAAGRAGDLQHALKLLEAAIAGSRVLGMVPWQERATRLVKDLQGRGVPDHPLSSREVEVAGLVAEGVSNRAMARPLYLSARTDESHVKDCCDNPSSHTSSPVASWYPPKRPLLQ